MPVQPKLLSLFLAALLAPSSSLTSAQQTASSLVIDTSTPAPIAADPIWGCEAPALPPGAVHVVVSSYNAEPEQLLPWLWHLGLTNAIVYVYYRTNDTSIPAMYGSGDVSGTATALQLPCNMTLRVLPLLPNKGREAAVFLHHLVTHYQALPAALMLAHDHGPASRHSLCGPFYRRARGYYRGLWEREQVEAGAEGGRRKEHEPSVFERFASMMVTLSSGCSESWARGCCATFVCSSSPQICPFAPEDCTASQRDPRVTEGPTPGVRQTYMHVDGFYDVRHENKVVVAGEASYPVALLRYTGAAHRSAGMWNISTEYPPGEQRASREETAQLLQSLISRYRRSGKAGGGSGSLSRRRASPRRLHHAFKSCCGSFLMRREQVLRWPVEMYGEMLAYSMDPKLDYEATKAVSGPGWYLWTDRDYDRRDVMTYMQVDVRLKSIQGCPSQRQPHLQRIIADMRGRAAG
ncbi:hypothetical protein Agub_g11923 [Astrephomene gubernaculifera]|uniref:Uncharacterized protein n=1 Tax=Astrephomene gubernaculifera TaxID=47775 RepID=A0AAD3HR11_9CHLO|nr:hypothetical protein Agub_g11923 [Astrephomene gubernaculifera]